MELADLRKDEYRFFKQDEEDPLIDPFEKKVNGPEWGEEENRPKLNRTLS